MVREINDQSIKLVSEVDESLGNWLGIKPTEKDLRLLREWRDNRGRDVPLIDEMEDIPEDTDEGYIPITVKIPLVENDEDTD